jgi:hypothetical protein
MRSVTSMNTESREMLRLTHCARMALSGDTRGAELDKGVPDTLWWSMGFILGLVSNVVANVVFWVLLGIVFWALTTTVARRFSRFFGLGRVNGVTVFVSNLWNPSASTSGKTVGYTISMHELWAAQSVDRLFSSASLRLPDLVRGLVDALWLHGRAQLAIKVSPPEGEDADLDRNLIVVGSSTKNSVRARYVQARLPTAILTGEDQVPDRWQAMKAARSITIVRGGTESKVNFTDVNLALIEKCHDPDRGTTIFFCLGLRGDGSWAATEYLARNWKRLAVEFGDADFVMCLGFPQPEKYADEYREPLRLSIGSG